MPRLYCDKVVLRASVEVESRRTSQDCFTVLQRAILHISKKKYSTPPPEQLRYVQQNQLAKTIQSVRLELVQKVGCMHVWELEWVEGIGVGWIFFH